VAEFEHKDAVGTTPHYSTSEKLLLEGRLVFGSFADKEVLRGAKDSLKETFSWRGLEEIGTGLVVGGGIGRLLESKRGRTAGLLISAGLLATFVASTAYKIGKTGVDTWQNPEHFNNDQKELANYYGKTLTDATKSILTGMGVGAAYGRYSTVVSRKILEHQFAPKITGFHIDPFESLPGVVRVEKLFAPKWAKTASHSNFGKVTVTRGDGAETFTFDGLPGFRTGHGSNLKQLTFTKDQAVIEEAGGKRITIEKSGRKTIEDPDGDKKVISPSAVYFSPSVFAQSEIGQRIEDAARDLGYSQWFHQIVGHTNSLIHTDSAKPTDKVDKDRPGR
jgi:hypothetical protein